MRRYSMAILVTPLLWAQQHAGSDPAFEVASIRASQQRLGLIIAARNSTPTRVTYRNYSLKRLVREAYELSDYQLDGPSWLDVDRYDIVANKPAGKASDAALMKSLLHDRFHLAAHWEKRRMASYVLLPGKAAKLIPAPDEENTPGCPEFGTMAEFARMLSHNMEKPVADQTGITGRYYFVLAYSNTLSPQQATQGAPPAPAAPPPPTGADCHGQSLPNVPVAAGIFEAVRNQMGLRLERGGDMNADVLVVDRADRTPVAN